MAEIHGENDSRRIAGSAGLVFVAWMVIVISTVYGLVPKPFEADSAATFRQYYIDNAGLYRVISWLAPAAWLFGFLPFAAGVRSLFDGAGEASGRMWARLSFAGAVLTTAIGGSGLVYDSVLASGVAAEAPDELVRVLALMRGIVDDTILGWGLALFFVGAALAIRADGLLDRRLAWLGLLAAVCLALGAAWPMAGGDQGPVAMVGLIGWAATAIWILIVGIAMVRGRLSGVAGEPGAAPARAS